jgi:phosphoglycolate phosphatase
MWRTGYGMLWWMATGIPKFSVYLFDVDGTLLDSATDICSSIQEVIVSEGVGAPPIAELRELVGMHLVDFFAGTFPDCGEAKLEELFQAYRTTYRARGHRDTRVFPGVVEGLELLGGRKSTATTKGSPMTRSILEQFGLSRYFDHIQGTDGFPSKPEPDVIFAALRAMGQAPGDCLMVGDSTADIEAARAAGVKSCAVRYGYGDPVKLAVLEPDYWVDDLRELSSDR